MNHLSKLLSFALGATLTVLALPGVAAPQKLYSLTMCVGAFDLTTGACNADAQNPGSTNRIQARIFNASPPRLTNSSINSFDLHIINDLPWRIVDARLVTNSGQLDFASLGHIKVSNLSPVRPQESVIVELTVDQYSCGEGIWDVTPYTGSSLGGSTFAKGAGFIPPKTPVACGNLACGESITVQPAAGTDPSHPRYVSLKRSLYNQDGTTVGDCDSLLVLVTPTVDPNVVIHTDWDPAQPDADIALFRYSVNLPSDDPPIAQVAWLFKMDGTLDWQNALACEPKSPDLPQLYGTLAADNGGKIQVNLATPPLTVTVPFPITIEGDRMVVTKVISATNTWFVTRAANSPTHTAGPDVRVLSTPLPIVKSTDGYPASYVGEPAKMCKISDPSQNGSTWSVPIIDGADGYVRGSF